MEMAITERVELSDAQVKAVSLLVDGHRSN